jgi:hypothetical protein
VTAQDRRWFDRDSQTSGELIRRTALLLIVFATAFVFDIAVKALFDSRSAGAVAVIIVLLAFTPVVYRPAVRQLSRERLLRLCWFTAGTIPLVAASILFVPAPYGGGVALLVSSPVSFQWFAAMRRTPPHEG